MKFNRVLIVGLAVLMILVSGCLVFAEEAGVPEGNSTEDDTIIDNDTITKYGVDSASAGNMINNFNFIKELYAWAFSSYDEKNDIYKINIRSRGPIINTVAQKYNGGGHKFASGARLKNLDDADPLIKELDKLCEKYKK